MNLYTSEEDANAAAVMETVGAAFNAGFTEKIVDEGHVFCSKPKTMELVDVFPDGSWEYQNVNKEGKVEEMSGTTAALLALYLGDHKKMFQESKDE